jgi:hypothetical protein
MCFSFQNLGFDLGHGRAVNLRSKKTMTGKGLVVSFTNICTKKFESVASNFSLALRAKLNIPQPVYIN